MPDITIKAKDGGSFSGYLALPKSGKGPGVVVIQEIFGVNEVMRRISDDIAAQGYVALCPDLFWRQEPGIQITDKTEAEWQKAFQLYQGFDREKGIEDIKATIETLRAHSACTGKVGAVGFCLGACSPISRRRERTSTARSATTASASRVFSTRRKTSRSR